MQFFSCLKKNIFLIVIGSLLSIIILSLAYLISVNTALKNNEALVNISNQIFKLEIVSDPLDVYRGLSNRKELCEKCGMLFVFPDLSERTFVMRNMNFPLDIIFLAEGRIVKIHANLPPEGSNVKNLYSSNAPADQVLEINAGLAAQLGLREGAELILPH